MPATRSRAWRGISVLFLICVAIGALPLAIIGGIERAHYQAGGFSLFGVAVAAIGLAILLLPSAVVLGVSHDRGASKRVQASLGIGLTLFIGTVAFPFFALTIGCILTSECV